MGRGKDNNSNRSLFFQLSFVGKEFLDLPNQDRRVVASGRQHFAIRRKGHGSNAAAVSVDLSEDFPALDVHKANGILIPIP